MGGIAVRGGGIFSDEEIQLLRELPAVANVTHNIPMISSVTV